MKTLISCVLLFCILATALAPLPSQPQFFKKVLKTLAEPNCKKYEGKKCDLNLNPVCGTNGGTYYNECALCVFIRDSTKKSDKMVKIHKWGKC
uniref:Proteinase inhibitor n=1 Tax=Cruziohyla calcarifer TaxID=318249 RepID=A0A1W2KE59_CRUCA|nr:proteinase inhibitor precursor [Cruziohyla calcarifer]